MIITALALALAAAPAPLLDVPFTDDFGLVFLEARINGSRPLAFQVDTGFDVNVLNADVAAELDLRPAETRTTAQPGGSVEEGATPPARLQIGDRSQEGVTFTAMPLTPLGTFVGHPLDGILGHDFLAAYVVDVDYPARRFRLWDPATFVAPATGQVLPLDIVEKEPFVQVGVHVGPRTVYGRFKVDTGSLDLLGMNLNFAQGSHLVDGIPDLPAPGVAVGGATEARVLRASSVHLGTHRVDAPLIGYTTNSGGFEVRRDAGTIGGELLTRFRLVMDYPGSRMILEERAGNPPTPSQDASGLLLVTGPDYQGLFIQGFIDGSPASAAGLRAGEQILTLDGRRDVSLREARLLLEKSGPLRLQVKGEKGTREVVLQRKALLAPVAAR